MLCALPVQLSSGGAGHARASAAVTTHGHGTIVHVCQVAEMGLCAPLPPAWAEVVTQEPGEAAPSVSFK